MLQSQLAPSEEAGKEEQPPDTYEVTLRIPQDRLSAVRTDLDVLIARYDLETHVRQR